MRLFTILLAISLIFSCTATSNFLQKEDPIERALQLLDTTELIGQFKSNKASIQSMAMKVSNIKVTKNNIEAVAKFKAEYEIVAEKYDEIFKQLSIDITQDFNSFITNADDYILFYNEMFDDVANYANTNLNPLYFEATGNMGISIGPLVSLITTVVDLVIKHKEDFKKLAAPALYLGMRKAFSLKKFDQLTRSIG